MTLLLAICVAVIFAVSIYLLLSKELKAIAMGVFLFSHAAHLGIIAMSGQPVLATEDGGVLAKRAPVLSPEQELAYVDPLPQALILTSIVISFAVMAFILTLLVATYRRTGTLNVLELAAVDRPEPALDGDEESADVAHAAALHGSADEGVLTGPWGPDSIRREMGHDEPSVNGSPRRDDGDHDGSGGGER